MHNYYSVSKSQLDWLNLPHSPTLPPPVTVKHRVVKFLETSPSKGDQVGENILYLVIYACMTSVG